MVICRSVTVKNVRYNIDCMHNSWVQGSSRSLHDNKVCVLKSEIEIRKMYSQALGRMEDLRQQFQGPNTLSAVAREEWKKTMQTVEVLHQILHDTPC